MKLIKYNHILWDWNGTLFDDVDASISAINISLDKHNLPLLDRKRYYEIFGFPVEGYYQRLGFDLSQLSYDELAKEFINNYIVQSNYNARLQNNAVQTLGDLKKIGIPQSILSASEKEMLVGKLVHFEIMDCFEDIIALDNIYAESKLQIGMEWMKTNGNNQKVLLIGDSAHDYEVASHMGIDCILFAGGHGRKRDLLQFNIPIIDNLEQIKNYIYCKQDRKEACSC